MELSACLLTENEADMRREDRAGHGAKRRQLAVADGLNSALLPLHRARREIPPSHPVHGLGELLFPPDLDPGQSGGYTQAGDVGWAQAPHVLHYLASILPGSREDRGCGEKEQRIGGYDADEPAGYLAVDVLLVAGEHGGFDMRVALLEDWHELPQ